MKQLPKILVMKKLLISKNFLISTQGIHIFPLMEEWKLSLMSALNWHSVNILLQCSPYMERDNKLLLVEGVISDSEERWMRVTHEISTHSNKTTTSFWSILTVFNTARHDLGCCYFTFFLVTPKQTCFWFFQLHLLLFVILSLFHTCGTSHLINKSWTLIKFYRNSYLFHLK